MTTTITNTAILPDQGALQGLNMQAIVQQALSGLPPNAPPAEKQAAIQAAITQAASTTAPGAAPAHARKRTKFFDLEDTFKRMEAERHKKEITQYVIKMGSGASVDEIQSALRQISISDSGYGDLQRLYSIAQERERQIEQERELQIKQQTAAVGGLNVMG